MQPTYLPWMGYFELIAQADIFVFLDTVQFAPSSWQSRNRLLGHNGQPFWLIVPVAKTPLQTPLYQVQIFKSGSPNRPTWAKKHLKSIQRHLGKTDFFKYYYPDLEAWLSNSWNNLCELNIFGIQMIATWLNLKPHFLKASDLNSKGRNVTLLLNICKELKAERYYSPMGAQNYIAHDSNGFDREGILLDYQTWIPPQYPQGRNEFISHLSVIDGLFRVGPQSILRMIRKHSSDLPAGT